MTLLMNRSLHSYLSDWHKKMFKTILFSIFMSSSVLAGEYPTYWPWRGVNIPVDILEREKDVIKDLRKAKVNAVRIHMDYKKLMKLYQLDSNEVLELSITMTDNLLNQLAKNNMTAMLGIEVFPQEDLECNSKLDPIFWETKNCIDKMYEVAEKLTSYFKSRGNELAAYQFISEPVVKIDGKSKRPENWVEIQSRLLQIVEKNDPERFFVITAGPWGMPQGYKDFEPLPSNKVIYNAHFFQPQRYTHQGIGKKAFDVVYPGWIKLKYWDKTKLEKSSSKLIKFQKKHDVPILIGSFSKMNWIKDDNQWLIDSLNIFENNQWSWLYFMVGEDPWHGWDPRYIGDYEEKKINYFGETNTWKLLKEYFLTNQE